MFARVGTGELDFEEFSGWLLAHDAEAKAKRGVLGAAFASLPLDLIGHGITRQEARMALLHRAEAGAAAMALAAFRQRRPAVFGWYGPRPERWLFRHDLLELDQAHDAEYVAEIAAKASETAATAFVPETAAADALDILHDAEAGAGGGLGRVRRGLFSQAKVTPHPLEGASSAASSLTQHRHGPPRAGGVLGRLVPSAGMLAAAAKGAQKKAASELGTAVGRVRIHKETVSHQEPPLFF